VTTLGAVTTQAGGQSLAGKAAIVHSVDMAQPAEAVDAKLVADRADVTALAD